MGAETGISGLRVVDLVRAEATVVRQPVLRPDVPPGLALWPEDDDPRTLHLGVLASDLVVGVVSLRPEPTPYRPGVAAMRFYAMAVREEWQRRGAGSVLLRAAIARGRASAAGVLWANARDSALGFYQRLGFTVVGDGFINPAVDIPHHVVLVDLPPRASRE